MENINRGFKLSWVNCHFVPFISLYFKSSIARAHSTSESFMGKKMVMGYVDHFSMNWCTIPSCNPVAWNCFSTDLVGYWGSYILFIYLLLKKNFFPTVQQGDQVRFIYFRITSYTDTCSFFFLLKKTKFVLSIHLLWNVHFSI